MTTDAQYSATYRRRHPERAREAAKRWAAKKLLYYKWQNIYRKYRLRFEDWLDLWIRQHARCACCGITFFDIDDANVDHDHQKVKGEVGFVRGLICSPCNQTIGFSQEDPARLRAAAEYLEK